MIEGRIASIDVNQNMIFITDEDASRFHVFTFGGYGPLPDKLHTLVTYHLAFRLPVNVMLAPGVVPKAYEGDLAAFSQKMMDEPPESEKIVQIEFPKAYDDCLEHLEALKKEQGVPG